MDQWIDGSMQASVAESVSRRVVDWQKWVNFSSKYSVNPCHRESGKALKSTSNQSFDAAYAASAAFHVC